MRIAGAKVGADRVGGRLGRRRDRQPGGRRHGGSRQGRRRDAGSRTTASRTSARTRAASIRPQSLIGERFVDCKPTQPRAPGSPPPPELEEIPDGEPGEGQRLLPLENNGKAVDLDLIQNINRAPYRDRFRIILNELGAGLAARGDDLGAVIDRANPALRQTDRVLKILADQSDQLDRARRQRRHRARAAGPTTATAITGFITNARIAGEATAERGDDLEAQLQKFPATLREVRLTMTKLKDFADQGTPLMDRHRRRRPRT